jgi:hypothetical protein
MPNTRKATYSGTCQVCGSLQLLPSGLLSLHGYTTRWGFFSGICHGAKNLPFEQDKSLIEEAIERAEAHRTHQKQLAHDLRQKPAIEGDSTKAWVHLYRAASWDKGNRKGGYEWHEVVLTRIETTENYGTAEKPYLVTRVNFTFENPITKRADSLQAHGLHYGIEKSDLATAAQVLNTKKAEAVHDATVKQLTQYIAWQRDRIANWAPQPLIARKAS